MTFERRLQDTLRSDELYEMKKVVHELKLSLKMAQDREQTNTILCRCWICLKIFTDAFSRVWAGLIVSDDLIRVPYPQLIVFGYIENGMDGEFEISFCLGNGVNSWVTYDSETSTLGRWSWIAFQIGYFSLQGNTTFSFVLVGSTFSPR